MIYKRKFKILSFEFEELSLPQQATLYLAWSSIIRVGFGPWVWTSFYKACFIWTRSYAVACVVFILGCWTLNFDVLLALEDLGKKKGKIIEFRHKFKLVIFC